MAGKSGLDTAASGGGHSKQTAVASASSASLLPSQVAREAMLPSPSSVLQFIAVVTVLTPVAYAWGTIGTSHGYTAPRYRQRIVFTGVSTK